MSPNVVDASIAPPLAISAAARWYGAVLVGAWIFVVLQVALILSSVIAFIAGHSTLAGTCAVLSAIMGVGVAGFLPVLVLVSGRRRLADALDAAQVAQQQRAAAESAQQTSSAQQALFIGAGETDVVVKAERERLLALAGWPQIAAALPSLLISAAMLYWLWPSAGTVLWGFGVGIACLIVAFPVLLIERRFSVMLNATHADLPEADNLARLMRVVLWGLIVVGVAEIARSMGASSAVWGLWIYSGLLLLFISEIALRVIAAPFLPAAVSEEARGLSDSYLAGLILPRLGAGRGRLGGLKERFGIDVSQSWAWMFVKRASLPVFLLLLLCAWGLSSISMISLHERGIYERNGKVSAVLSSGMHVHLPWPFGVVRRMDFGRVHTLQLADEITPTSERLPADGLDTSSYDRLWNTDHKTDGTFLVPGSVTEAADGLQASQILQSDVRIYYRIGLSDAAARAALYYAVDPAQTVRFFARRELVRLFAARPLFSAMGESRRELSAEVRERLQQQLSMEQTGLEIVALSIDSIHPPVKAASAYFAVQEAEINSTIDVTRARREAVTGTSDKIKEAHNQVSNASAQAAETLSKARADKVTFAADAQAWSVASTALSYERWLQALMRGLAQSHLTIIDHRLHLADGPVLDLRSYSGTQSSSQSLQKLDPP
jgi:regulator of protease activity HflC (stomatin/prohibitin superfamily)